MDGSARATFLTSPHVKTPNGLTINYKTNELCWTDVGRKQIVCAEIDNPSKTRKLLDEVITTIPEIFLTKLAEDMKLDKVKNLIGSLPLLFPRNSSHSI